MKGLTTDGACELIKSNKRQEQASTRKTSYSANFLFRVFFGKNVSNYGLVTYVRNHKDTETQGRAACAQGKHDSRAALPLCLCVFVVTELESDRP